jgi:hypothetical protein
MELKVAMDANMRLRLKKQKTKRSDNDPELSTGAMYMVQENDYQATLEQHNIVYPNAAQVRNGSSDADVSMI